MGDAIVLIRIISNGSLNEWDWAIGELRAPLPMKHGVAIKPTRSWVAEPPSLITSFNQRSTPPQTQVKRFHHQWSTFHTRGREGISHLITLEISRNLAGGAALPVEQENDGDERIQHTLREFKTRAEACALNICGEPCRL